jgi:hypothetical protein
VERRCTQRGGGLERDVGVLLIVASPHHRSVVITAAADGHERQERGLELTTSSSPSPRGPADGPHLCGPSRTGASESQRAAPRQADPTRRSEECPTPVRQLYDGSDRPDSDSLQRCRSRVRSTASVSTPSMPPAVDSGAALRRLQSLLVQGGGASDVHVSPAATEAGGSAPEQSGECIAAVEVADRSGAVPELAGSKRATPEQGSSGRLAKKSWVCSKM